MHTTTTRAQRHASTAGIGFALLASVLFTAPLASQEHTHSADDAHDVHFTHPLFAESVSPDTKLRLDYGFRDLGEGGESELELEGEYAFARAFSIEAGLHFDPGAGDPGETHVVFKFANYALEQAGVLLGYGLELGLPTGSAHAHGGIDEEESGEPGHEEPLEDDIYEITPFLNAGWISGSWELVGWTLFEIPTNQGDQHDVGTELRYNASILRHAGQRIDLLLEAFGRRGLSGPQTDDKNLNLAPGLRVHPLARSNLVLGAGVALPLTDDRDADARLLVSAFYHF